MAVMGGWKIFARNGGQGRNRRGGGGVGGWGGWFYNEGMRNFQSRFKKRTFTD